MSALLGVSIAVVIFRIQRLENRLQSLEQFTLDYIYKIATFSYSYWTSRVEKHIRNGMIVQRYYRRLNRLTDEIIEKIKEGTDEQQESLLKSLEEHDRIPRIIQQTKNSAYWSFILLMLPILTSFFLLMISDAFDNIGSFFFVSVIILLSGLGIFSLVMTIETSLDLK